MGRGSINGYRRVLLGLAVLVLAAALSLPVMAEQKTASGKPVRGAFVFVSPMPAG